MDAPFLDPLCSGVAKLRGEMLDCSKLAELELVDVQVTHPSHEMGDASERRSPGPLNGDAVDIALLGADEEALPSLVDELHLQREEHAQLDVQTARRGEGSQFAPQEGVHVHPKQICVGVREADVAFACEHVRERVVPSLRAAERRRP